MVSMKAFSKFDNTAEALAAAASMVDSKIGKDLKKFLKKHAEGETLALADAKLGGLIKEKLGIACVPPPASWSSCAVSACSSTSSSAG